MQIPFTVDQFLNVFKDYNQSVFPIQIVFYLAALYLVYLLFKPGKNSGKIITAVLSFLWLWIGVVYHLMFFTSINKAAYFFGILFIVQGVIFLYFGVIKNRLYFAAGKNLFAYAGSLFILYALIIYPVLGYYLGHQYPYSPTFGLPCPTTIFTFGILLFAKERIPISVLIIPLLWSIIGFGAALNLSIYEDLGLLIAGVLGSLLLIYRNNKYFRNPKNV